MMIQFERFYFAYLLLISYLLVLNVFNTVDLSLPLVVVFGCGILSLLFKRQQLLAGKWLIGLSVVLVLLGVLAFYAPSTGIRTTLTNWSAPVRNALNARGFYQALQHVTPSGPSRTGFSENDGQLGGPLLDDNTILFEATQQRSSYWRVESKDFYSGRGWENTAPEQSQFSRRSPLEHGTTFYQHAFSEPEESTVHFFNHGIYVPLPYGRSIVQATEGTTGFVFLEETGRVNFIDSNNGEKEILNQWSTPDYQLSDLAMIQPQLPLESQVDYLQLPNELPARIRDLAESLTANEETMLGKVTAIENHLKNNSDLRYSKVDTDFPPENQDYVDHFLFDSQVGYCDNFSTAMVVLLRSVGIPARWTKGFAPGDAGQVDSDTTVYTVRNQHAHSWVEVYFDSYGWLPFEPTPSFSNPDRPSTENSSAPADTAEESTDEVDQDTISSEAAESSFEEQSADQETDQRSPENRTLTVLLALAGVIAAGFFVGRRYLLSLQISWFNRFSKEPARRIYPLILKQVEKSIPRQPSETLRAYGKRVEAAESLFTGRFISFIDCYELMLYNKKEFEPLSTSELNDLVSITERLKKN
ncbi:hypothetical protein NRIC_10380 [Enterococcus florum]|uniref:Transglutaminase-like domain-containing protein n=2 Tax=Enterococcus florum TaxID=2480627 RepID=A0A4P5P5M1_9ENTE|nr:hypothetical protein NRIC_10380 [Enterococcus florum]